MRTIWMVALLLIALAGCQLPPLPRQQAQPAAEHGRTPEETARRAVARLSAQPPARVTIHGMREASGMTIVLFTAEPAQALPQAEPPLAGYVVVERHEGAWSHTAAVMEPPGPLAGTMLAGTTHAIPHQGDEHQLVYGLRLRPEVVGVEVALDNGQRFRDTLTGDMFAIVFSTQHSICRIEILEGQGRVVQHAEATDVYRGPDAQQQIARCRR